MRRRTPIQVWPAVADLMTVLAVVGLVLALVLTTAREEGEKLPEDGEQVPIEELNRKSAELDEARLQLAELKRRFNELEDRCRSDLAECTAEVARNEVMFQAIQRVQSVIDRVSANMDLSFDQDQSLAFGENLVRFDLNSLELAWLEGGRSQLQKFCSELEQVLDSREFRGGELSETFVLFVEGHTDSSVCPEDPDCNWYYSMARATRFARWMGDSDLCPVVRRLEVRPVGFSDSRPPESGVATRRVSLRLVPKYEKLVRSASVPGRS